MIFGYLSGEWLFIAAVGFGVSALFAFSAPSEMHTTFKYWLTGTAIVVVHYLLMRVIGRTPIGIALPTEPAGRGHPRLSVAVCLVSMAIWISRIAF